MTGKTISADVKVPQRAIDDIIAQLSAEALEAERIAERIYSIEERLQGSRPQKTNEETPKPAPDHMTLLQHHIGRLVQANRATVDMLSNIETII